MYLLYPHEKYKCFDCHATNVKVTKTWKGSYILLFKTNFPWICFRQIIRQNHIQSFPSKWKYYFTMSTAFAAAENWSTRKALSQNYPLKCNRLSEEHGYFRKFDGIYGKLWPMYKCALLSRFSSCVWRSRY